MRAVTSKENAPMPQRTSTTERINDFAEVAKAFNVAMKAVQNHISQRAPLALSIMLCSQMICQDDSVKAMALRFNMSRKHLRNILSGRRKPKPKYHRAIAEYLGMSQSAMVSHWLRYQFTQAIMGRKPRQW